MKHRSSTRMLITACVYTVTHGVVAAQPPDVGVPPASATICAGDAILFTVEQVNFFDGQAPDLQWQFNGADLNDGDRSGRVTIVSDLTDLSAAMSVLTIAETDRAVEAGEYTCIAQTSDQGSTTTAPAILTFYDAPSVTPTADPAALCVGDQTELAANPTGSDPPNQLALWIILTGPNTSGLQFSPFPPTVQNPTFTPTDAGIYVLRAETVDSVCAVSASDTLTIEVFEPLAADPTPSATSTCIEIPVPLTANPSGGDGNYRFTWTIVSQPPGSKSSFLPDDTAANPTFTPTAVGDYDLTVVISTAEGSDLGCRDSQPVGVTVAATDELTVQASAINSEICLGAGTLVQADAGGIEVDYAWSVENGPDTSSAQFSNTGVSTPQFTPSTAGDYSLGVVVTSGACNPGEDFVMLTVHDALLPEPNAAPGTICLGDQTQLAANPGGSGVENQFFTWTVSSGPDTSDSQFSDPSIANPTFTPSTVTSPDDEYLLIVEVTDLACVDLQSGDVTLTVNAAVTAAPSADPPMTCSDVAVQLLADPAGGDGTYTYTWSVAVGPSDLSQFDDFTAEQPMFTPTAGPITYTLGVAVDDGMCPSAEPVFFLSLPVEAALGINPVAEFDPTVLGVSMMLHANSVGGTDPQFNWNVAALPPDCQADDPIADPNTADPTFTPHCLGTYTLTVAAEDDVCDGVVAGLLVDVILLAAEPSADQSSLCVGGPAGSAMLIPNVNVAFGPYDYTWTILQGPDTSSSQFDDPNAESPQFTPTTAGDYTIQVEVDDVAEVLPTITGEVELSVSDALPTIDGGGQPAPRTVCVGETATFSITASGTDLTYQWQLDGADLFGKTASTITVPDVRFTDTGDYSCVVSNGCGAVTSQNAGLTVQPRPLTLLAVAREDTMLREAQTADCAVTPDLLDRGDMTSPVQRAVGLAVDPITGTLYAAVRTSGKSAETWLATVDPYSGVATLIASMGEPISDLAFSPEGALYAVRGNKLPVADFMQGEIVTVDTTDASLTSLDPRLSFGDEEGHSITFDGNGLLYHHGREPNTYSRLNSITLATEPAGSHIIDLKKDYGSPFPEWTALTIDEREASELFLAATREGELWSVDPDNDYEQTVLGPINPQGGGDVTLTGLAFVCAVFGDANCDGAIDLVDYEAFDSCSGDPSISSVCGAFDHDGDGDIDLLDWGAFQETFTAAAP